jgi:DNA-binding IclR family transcriptional regulator
LEGTGDFWDRPYGTGGHACDGAAEEERALVNSLYRLGTKALRRGELAAAADLLGRAGEQGHPGALFRLAVVVHRRYGDEGREDAEFLVAEAARLGHGDARAMLEAALAPETAGGTATTGDHGQGIAEQDAEFSGEVRAALGLSPAAAARSRTPAGHPSSPPAAPSRGAPSRHDGAGAAVVAHVVTPAAPPAPALRPPGGLWVPGGRAGPGTLWTPSPLRSPYLVDLARQVPSAHESAERWRQAMRVLDVLRTIGGADGPLSADRIARGTGLETTALEQLLAWLAEQRLVAVPEPGAYGAGPLLRLWAEHEGTARENALRKVLSELRDRVGAAVYVSHYADGEVRVTQCAAGPDAPAVREHVPFREAAHASAVGKSLLAQLDFEGRMDHLDRRRPVPLTQRTITDHRHLFQALDHHGPQAAQFDLLEYSDDEVCVAFPLTVADRAGCVALSLPLTQKHRLLEAADALSSRSATLLATLLLAGDPPAGDGQSTTRDGQDATRDGQGTTRDDGEAEAFVRTGAPPRAE